MNGRQAACAASGATLSEAARAIHCGASRSLDPRRRRHAADLARRRARPFERLGLDGRADDRFRHALGGQRADDA